MLRNDPIIVSFLELRDLMRENPELIDKDRFAAGKAMMKVEMDGSVDFTDAGLQAAYDKLFKFTIMDISSGAQMLEQRSMTLYKTAKGFDISEDMKGAPAKGPIVLRLSVLPEAIVKARAEFGHDEKRKGLPEEATNMMMYFLAALWSQLLR